MSDLLSAFRRALSSDFGHLFISSIAEAGSLHGPTFRLPHSLLHTNAASASPSTSSTTIGKGREPVLHLSLAVGVASATGELSLAALKQPAFNAYTS
jgi:hypothetical protein